MQLFGQQEWMNTRGLANRQIVIAHDNRAGLSLKVLGTRVTHSVKGVNMFTYDFHVLLEL